MTRALPGLVAAAVLLGASPALPAIESGLDDLALSEALSLARRGGSVVDAFHAPYTTVVGDSTYERLEIISEFRRAVLIATEQLQVDQRWNLGQLRTALMPYRGSVGIVLRIRFPPQNVLVSVPDYGLVVYPEGAGALGAPGDSPRVLESTSTSATPLFLAGGGDTLVGPPGSPLSALHVEAWVPAAGLPARGTITVGLLFEGEEQRRVDVSLTGLR